MTEVQHAEWHTGACFTTFAAAWRCASMAAVMRRTNGPLWRESGKGGPRRPPPAQGSFSEDIGYVPAEHGLSPVAPLSPVSPGKAVPASPRAWPLSSPKAHLGFETPKLFLNVAQLSHVSPRSPCQRSSRVAVRKAFSLLHTNPSCCSTCPPKRLQVSAITS